jgi:hypothetical protein
MILPWSVENDHGRVTWQITHLVGASDCLLEERLAEAWPAGFAIS